SEIVAAALQDHQRAWVLGERTYGLASVQNIQPFEDGAIKLTRALFRRPSGRNLNKSSTGGQDEDEWGVAPDEVIQLTSKERADLSESQRFSEIIQPSDRPAQDKPEFKDRQLEAALEYLRLKSK